MLVLHDLRGATYPFGRLDVDTLTPAQLAGFGGHEAEVIARARAIKADALAHAGRRAPLVLRVTLGPASPLMAQPFPMYASGAPVATGAVTGRATVVRRRRERSTRGGRRRAADGDRRHPRRREPSGHRSAMAACGPPTAAPAAAAVARHGPGDDRRPDAGRLRADGGRGPAGRRAALDHGWRRPPARSRHRPRPAPPSTSTTSTSTTSTTTTLDQHHLDQHHLDHAPPRPAPPRPRRPPPAPRPARPSASSTTTPAATAPPPPRSTVVAARGQLPRTGSRTVAWAPRGHRADPARQHVRGPRAAAADRPESGGPPASPGGTTPVGWTPVANPDSDRQPADDQPPHDPARRRASRSPTWS